MNIKAKNIVFLILKVFFFKKINGRNIDKYKAKENIGTFIVKPRRKAEIKINRRSSSLSNKVIKTYNK